MIPPKGYELVLQTNDVRKIHYQYDGYIWVGAFGQGADKNRYENK
jgi:hypothetical protein